MSTLPPGNPIRHSAPSQGLLSPAGSQPKIERPTSSGNTPIKANQSVSVLCDNTQQLEHIDDALKQCANAGFKLDGLKVYSTDKTDSLLSAASTQGAYRADLKAVIFRHDTDWNTLAQETQKQFPEWAKKTYSGRPSHLALHELGHSLHHQCNPSAFSKIANTRFDKKTSKAILAEMGHNYPTRNAGEFVAEMFAGLMGGKHFSLKLLKLYQKCKGPLPPHL